MSLNQSKALLGLSVPIEPEERSLVMEIGWKFREDIADFAWMLIPGRGEDCDLILRAFGNVLLNHVRKLMFDLAERKR